MPSVLRRRSPLGARAIQLVEVGCSKPCQKRSFLTPSANVAKDGFEPKFTDAAETTNDGFGEQTQVAHRNDNTLLTSIDLGINTAR